MINNRRPTCEFWDDQCAAIVLLLSNPTEKFCCRTLSYHSNVKSRQYYSPGNVQSHRPMLLSCAASSQIINSSKALGLRVGPAAR
ncbi:hypothetical protein NDU88_004426 [Pleurodeles waltl]|uniref:Uncharacterized protein n=1 Tax=Pleurodeles waltl TaxID=8319 RepID=A0AAV7SIR9_PLEWA|nr:hypothetical protein NDU88_004426 [Pleurodeles waltl]